MLEMLNELPSDPILGLQDAYHLDNNPQKIDLGIGVYKNAMAETPVLQSVKQAEKFLLRTEATKTYVNMVGNSQFNESMSNLILGVNHSVLDQNRAVCIQAPGGCGALRLGAELVNRARPGAKIWLSDPTWANHITLFNVTGLQVATYPYYCHEQHKVRFDAMLATLESDAVEGDLVLIHACCHNPSGADLTMEQWCQLTELVMAKGLIPFIDMAYQGFGRDLEQDAQGLRYMAAEVPEMLIATSCSKNFGLYRERVGFLLVTASQAKMLSRISTHLVNVGRAMYSMAPSHGASIVATILSSSELSRQWRDEVSHMRERINSIRSLAVEKLNMARPQHDFGFMRRQQGMFSFLGLSEQQVLKLVNDYSIFMVGTSRINVAGLNEANMDYFVSSVASVLGEVE